VHARGTPFEKMMMEFVAGNSSKFAYHFQFHNVADKMIIDSLGDFTDCHFDK
jgi:hypothetical protein